MVKNAHDELRAWCERNGRTAAEVAKMLGVTRPQVSHLQTGARKPSLALATRIQALTGIPVTSWHDDKVSA